MRGKTIALWGLAFKPRTDDMREAPAIRIIDRLLGLGVTVRAYDPAAIPVARRLFQDRVTFCDRSYEALTGADAMAILTEWNEFREPDFERMKATESFSTNPVGESVSKNFKTFLIAVGLKLSEVSWVYMLTVFVVVYATTARTPEAWNCSAEA